MHGLEWRKVWQVLAGALLIAPALAAEVAATLDWARRAELSVPVSGVIREVTVQPGDRVEQGRVLLSLDARGFEARVAEAQAQARQAVRSRDEAKRELERTQELYERTLLSDHDLETARIDLDRAESALGTALARSTQANLDLEYSAIRAPFPAIVVERLAEPGEIILAELDSRTLIVLAEAGRMVARASIPLAQLRRLERGQSVEVIVEGRRYAGEVAELGFEPNDERDGVLLYPLAVSFAPESGLEYRPGQGASLALGTE